MNESDQEQIAIFGAGPIGLETALYARYLGYAVTVFERGDVCDNVARWGHVRMFTPFGMNYSSLGRAALTAQIPDHIFPADDQLVSGREWIDAYLQPLADSDLVSDSIRPGQTVLHVGRENFVKTESVGDSIRGDAEFRILTRTSQGNESVFNADIVIDTSGNFGFPNWMGAAGIPAIGESGIRISTNTDPNLPDRPGRFSSELPDWSRFAADRFAGCRILVVGSGFTAATNIVGLESIAQQSGCQIVWVTRKSRNGKPIEVIENDPLKYRRQLADSANQIASESDRLSWYPETTVHSITAVGAGGFEVEFAGQRGKSETFDYVVSNTGFRGDWSILSELQIHQCYATDGPMNWAASIIGSGGDCLQQTCTGPSALETPEPGCFIIGSKSYGRDPRFLFSLGLDQIRDVFKLIGGRPALDLYATTEPSIETGVRP